MKKGFTLIELLIVISIIGILAVALLPNIISAPATARDAGRKAALNSVVAALEQYKAANGAYPKESAKGTAIALTEANVTNISSYFKGTDVPAGAPVVAAAGDTVLGTTQAKDSTDVVYCPLNTNTGGYSYVVAIRMEQPQGGDNALNATTCADATGANLSGGTGNWYFLVQ